MNVTRKTITWRWMWKIVVRLDNDVPQNTRIVHRSFPTATMHVNFKPKSQIAKTLVAVSLFQPWYMFDISFGRFAATCVLLIMPTQPYLKIK